MYQHWITVFHFFAFLFKGKIGVACTSMLCIALCGNQSISNLYKNEINAIKEKER